LGINHQLTSPRKNHGFPSWDGKGGGGCEAFGGGTSTGSQPGAAFEGTLVEMGES